jgi:hypothetical protein
MYNRVYWITYRKGGSQMYYTGIDLHKKTSFLTTIDKDGKIVFRANLGNKEELILDYFTKLIQTTKIK